MSHINRYPAPAHTYYVDNTSGLDANRGNSEDAPWKTLAKVSATTFKAGDRILLKRGEHWHERLLPVGSGAPNRYIVFGAYGSGAIPTLDGTGVSFPSGEGYQGMIDIRGTTSKYIRCIRVQDLLLQYIGVDPDKADHAIYTKYAEGVHITNCEINDVVDSGIMLNFSIFGIIDYNLVKNCAHTTSNLDESVSINSSNIVEVAYNEIHSADIDPYDQCSIGVCPKQATSNVRIHHNHIHDMDGNGVYVCGWIDTVSDIFIYNNRIHDCIARGISAGSEETGPSGTGGLVQNVWIYNNLVYRMNQIGIDIDAGLDNGERRNIYICNNTIAKSLATYFSAMIVATTNLSGTILIRNNCCYWHDPDLGADTMLGQIRVHEDALALCTIDHNIVYGENDYQTDPTDHCPEADNAGEETWDDPEFNDWANDDYTLADTSPCIDAGATWTGIPGFDYAGNPRVVNGTVDVGAYEYQG